VYRRNTSAVEWQSVSHLLQQRGQSRHCTVWSSLLWCLFTYCSRAGSSARHQMSNLQTALRKRSNIELTVHIERRRWSNWKSDVRSETDVRCTLRGALGKTSWIPSNIFQSDKPLASRRHEANSSTAVDIHFVGQSQETLPASSCHALRSCGDGVSLKAVRHQSAINRCNIQAASTLAPRARSHE
jgi:hypothetical protein